MLLLVFLIAIAVIFLALMSQSFYLYKNRSNPGNVGRTTLISGIGYLTIALTLIVISIIMMMNTKVQYSVEFSKLVNPEQV